MEAPDFRSFLKADFDFDAAAASLWDYQVLHNPVMRRYAEALGASGPEFIPIAFFRDFEMKAGEWEPELRFMSSGTTGQKRSVHYVKEAVLYRESALRGFRHFYGEGSRTILALLPHYLEQGESSLVQMVRFWMEDFGAEDSGFYLNDLDALRSKLRVGDFAAPLMLIGVSYALLDLIEGERFLLPSNAVVMETGGMKGRRAEMTREALQAELSQGLGVSRVHSEYGMTELLSQAYSKGEGRFFCPPWMRVSIAEPWLPGRMAGPGESGRICITDLMNVHSCAFIRTEDLGRLHADGSFEVLGRMDHAESRGCNLLYELS